MHFLDWPSIVELMNIAYGFVILVHRNIQLTAFTIGYIQFRMGFEC